MLNRAQEEIPEPHAPRRRRWTPRLLLGRAEAGIELESSLTVNRSIVDLYQTWRQFETLPQAMRHVQRITPAGEKRFHWSLVGPLGRPLEWDAEITEERTNELIAWRSLEGSDVDSRGQVVFRRAPGGRGTEIQVRLRYRPPAGRLGSAVATLLGESPQKMIREELRRFKALMEAGEIPTTEGQPRGR
jgi:uncharacterized membrane protein